MRFSGALIISIVIYHSVVLSNGSFLKEKKLRNRRKSLVNKFFDEMKLEMKKRNPRQATVVGGSEDQLEIIKPLLKAFPYFVGETADRFCDSREHGPRCNVIYFLGSLEEEYIMKVMNELRNCTKHFVYLVFEGIASDSDIQMVLSTTAQKVTLEAYFVSYSAKSVKAYIYELQRDCSFRFTLKGNWTSKRSWKKLEPQQEGSSDLYDCALPIGLKHQKPRMNLEENENGTVKIIGGLEGNLISTVAQEMKFIPLIQRFDDSNQHANGTSMSIIASCADRKTMIGIANIRPTEATFAEVTMSNSYRQQCIVWCVPRIMQAKGGIIESEFSRITWIFVGLMFLAMLGVEKIVRNMHRPDRGNVKEPECFGIFLDVIGLTVGNPIIYKPLFMGSKFLLIIYLAYSIVITTAYKTYLASILTLGNNEPLIVDVEGIIMANITTGGNEFTLDVLHDQKDENKLIPELLKRFVVERNISKALQQVSQDKNLAYLISHPDLDYHKKLSQNTGKHLSIDVLNGCVLMHGTVMVLAKGSIFRFSMNKVVRKLTESGILNYWERNDTKSNQVYNGRAKNSEITNTGEKSSKFALDKLNSIFILYCLSLTFCTLIFFGELILHKFESLERAERSKIIKRLKIRPRVPI